MQHDRVDLLHVDLDMVLKGRRVAGRDARTDIRKRLAQRVKVPGRAALLTQGTHLKRDS